jgi:alpha-mannosidase
VQPDEFLVSGEALVRNLMKGIRSAEKIGGKATRIGYLPDSFGHIGQLPQIYKEFDIGVATFARGLQTERTELWWKSPDGTSILSIYLGNYCNGGGTPNPGPVASDGAAPSSVVDWWSAKKGGLGKRAETSQLLLLNGCDHTAMDPYLLKNVKLIQDNSVSYNKLRGQVALAPKMVNLIQRLY